LDHNQLKKVERETELLKELESLQLWLDNIRQCVS
jgi:hypothetical protein